MTSVKQIGIADLPRLWRVKQPRTALAMPDAVYHGHLDHVMAALPVGRRFSRVFMADADPSIRAIVEFKPERADYRWIVTTLAARAKGKEDRSDEITRVWSEILGYAARVAGHSGAKRVHAAVSVDTLAQRALIRGGFSIYGYQTVLMARRLYSPGHEDAPVREREPSDAWSIHHLYHMTTPRPVQYAEALTSNHWDARRTPNAQTRGYILDCDSGIAGFCQIMNRGDCYAVDVILATDKLSLLPALLTRALSLARLSDGAEVWISVPDYHREYVPVLESMGFHEEARQALMVRYTMVPVSGYQSRWVNVVTDVIERLPARTPVVTRWERDRA